MPERLAEFSPGTEAKVPTFPLLPKFPTRRLLHVLRAQTASGTCIVGMRMVGAASGGASSASREFRPYPADLVDCRLAS